MLFTGQEVCVEKNCAKGQAQKKKHVLFCLLFKVGKEIYRCHLVQSFFLLIVKVAFTVSALIGMHFP